MERGQPSCAIGACGVSFWPNLVSATSAGSLESVIDLAQSNLWNVDASRIIFSHSDIYKGRITNLVWELIALPRPQFVEIEVPGIPWNSGIYKNMTQENQYAMREINKFREMGEVGLKAVEELRALAFGVDEELKKGNWAAAEKGIRQIAMLKYFDQGWFVQLDMGLIEKGLIFDSSSVRAEWTPLNEVSVHLLLAHVLIKQGKCDEAQQEAKMGMGITQLFAYDEKWAVSRSFPYDKIRILNCH